MLRMIHYPPSGICDDDIAMCYCPPETKYGHVFAPEGSPPGTPPIKRGRPLYMCNPSTVRCAFIIRFDTRSIARLINADPDPLNKDRQCCVKAQW